MTQRWKLVSAIGIVGLLLFSSSRLLAITPYTDDSNGIQYVRAEVLQLKTGPQATGHDQLVTVRLLDGVEKNQHKVIEQQVHFGDNSSRRLPIGSQILLIKDARSGGRYSYAERWHMPGVGTLFTVLLILVVIIGGWRGITSMLGLAISSCVLAAFVLPRILAGQPAFTTCVQGAVIITVVSIYVAHGFSRRTTIAFVSSLLTLGMIIGLVGLATYLTGSSEVINEATVGILYSAHPISLSEMLTGGIVIASLGVLYDITTGQAAAVDEIYKADPTLPVLALYRKGLSVGREHIAALVNTLALVYAGVALPSIIITALHGHAPLLVTINNEQVIEEIVRTCVASIGMLLAVPLTTGLAAYALPKWYRQQAGNRAG